MVALETERRKHRRLDITLPVVFKPADEEGTSSESTSTINISTGGVFFGTDRGGIEPGRLLELELTIPPGQGHFPYEGRIRGKGVVVRVEPLEQDHNHRFGVAAQFQEPPKLAF